MLNTSTLFIFNMTDFTVLTWYKVTGILLFFILNIFLSLWFANCVEEKKEYLKCSFLGLQYIKRTSGFLVGSASIWVAYLSHKSYNLETSKLNESLKKALDETKKLQEEARELFISNSFLENKNETYKKYLIEYSNKHAKFSDKQQNLLTLLIKKDKATNLQEIAELEKNIEVEKALLLSEQGSISLTLKRLIESDPEVFKSKIGKEIAKNMSTADEAVKFLSFFITSSSSSSTSTSNAESIDDDLHNSLFFNFNLILDHYNKLDSMGKLAISLLINKSVLLSCLISIVFVIYGDFLIEKYKLEEKFPRLANIIKLRRRFQRYYLIFNILIILGIILVEVIFSIAILYL